MPSSPIDISMDNPLPAIWDEHTWICTRKKYPSLNTPNFILAEKVKILSNSFSICHKHPQQMANKWLSIADLLKCPLPL
jgi:hypothetical protein